MIDEQPQRNRRTFYTFQIPSKDSVRERLALLFSCPSFCWLLLWCVSKGAGAAFSHIFMKKYQSKKRQRAWWLVNVTWMGSSKEIVAAGVHLWVNFTSSCRVTECRWLLCFFSYSVRKEAMTNSFSSLSLLGQARWNAKTQMLQINSYFSNQHQP